MALFCLCVRKGQADLLLVISSTGLFLLLSFCLCIVESSVAFCHRETFLQHIHKKCSFYAMKSRKNNKNTNKTPATFANSHLFDKESCFFHSSVSPASRLFNVVFRSSSTLNQHTDGYERGDINCRQQTANSPTASQQAAHLANSPPCSCTMCASF